MLHTVSSYEVEGSYYIQHIRDRRIINTFCSENTFTEAGLNDILNFAFGPSSETAGYTVDSPLVETNSPLCIGLIDNNGYSAPYIIQGNSNFIIFMWNPYTAYTPFPAYWNQGSVSNGQITNSTPVTLTFPTPGVLNGIFLYYPIEYGIAPTGNHASILSVSVFDSPLTITANDLLNVTYTVSIVNVGD